MLFPGSSGFFSWLSLQRQRISRIPQEETLPLQVLFTPSIVQQYHGTYTNSRRFFSHWPIMFQKMFQKCSKNVPRMFQSRGWEGRGDLSEHPGDFSYTSSRFSVFALLLGVYPPEHPLTPYTRQRTSNAPLSSSLTRLKNQLQKSLGGVK